jgi:uncharacterized membrane protein
MYPLGTWFVSGVCVWIPCIKETMMMMIIIIIMIIIIQLLLIDVMRQQRSDPLKKQNKQTQITKGNRQDT